MIRHFVGRVELRRTKAMHFVFSLKKQSRAKKQKSPLCVREKRGCAHTLVEKFKLWINYTAYSGIGDSERITNASSLRAKRKL